MKRLFLILLTLTMLSVGFSANADIVVVVNKDNPVETLSTGELVDFYMGRYTTYPDGRTVEATDYVESNPIREAFYNKLVGKTVAQINAYWARLLFTGRAEPPSTLQSTDAIVEYVKNNTNAIAYIREQDLHHTMKVVFRFEDP